MKVNERKPQSLVEDAVKVTTDRQAIETAKQRIKQQATTDQAELDPVNIGLSAEIARAFDPAVIDSERRARVEEVKRKLAAGIFPTGEELAQSINDGVAELQGILGKPDAKE